MQVGAVRGSQFREECEVSADSAAADSADSVADSKLLE